MNLTKLIKVYQDALKRFNLPCSVLFTQWYLYPYRLFSSIITMYHEEAKYPKAHVESAHVYTHQLCLDLADAEITLLEARKLANVIINVMDYISANHNIPWITKLFWENVFREDKYSDLFSSPHGVYMSLPESYFEEILKDIEIYKRRLAPEPNYTDMNINSPLVEAYYTGPDTPSNCPSILPNPLGLEFFRSPAHHF